MTRVAPAILVLLLVFTPHPFNHLSTVANQASALAIVAVGMTMVVVTKGVDLSVGAVYALGAVLAAYASQWGVLPALLLPLVAGAFLGATQGWLIGRKRLAPFIVTISGLLFARGFGHLITNEGQRIHTVPPDSGFRALGHIAVAIALGVTLLCGLLLRRTSFGMRMTAVGGSEDASDLMGVPVARTKILVYTLSGTLAGLAGAIAAAQLGSATANIGIGLELQAIAAVAIGGTMLCGGSGTVAGTLAGVGVLWMIRDLVDQSPDMQAVISGALLIVIVVAYALLRRKRSGSFTQTE
ncbi:ABC transporter permease [Kibdelosporangium aridum]|uniref:Ribose transport system permease protein n=1 Tax=Kibdelosporangium aridum TaxID=2030 RepID=A0A1W2EPD4_KIBAR|nr:ABC transporter permease [Kibdelosporangium aridum]SMD11577.1 ribose transport system permease protein [Kibdelosporangium aridum]